MLLLSHAQCGCSEVALSLFLSSPPVLPPGWRWPSKPALPSHYGLWSDPLFQHFAGFISSSSLSFFLPSFPKYPLPSLCSLYRSSSLFIRLWDFRWGDKEGNSRHRFDSSLLIRLWDFRRGGKENNSRHRFESSTNCLAPASFRTSAIVRPQARTKPVSQGVRWNISTQPHCEDDS